MEEYDSKGLLVTGQLQYWFKDSNSHQNLHNSELKASAAIKHKSNIGTVYCKE